MLAYDKNSMLAPSPIQGKEESLETSTIAIVGAGIAGLSCAQRLRAAGWSVTLFDKGRRPGGRACSRQSRTGVQFDHGAQYFTVKTATFQPIVADWHARGVVAPWQGRIVQLQDGQTRPRDSDRICYVGTPSMAQIATHLAQDLLVHSETEIVSFTQRADGWQLIDNAGNCWGDYAWLVLALPAPQSAARLGQLPELQLQVAPVSMLPCWSVLVAWESPLPAPFDGAFVEDSPLSWVARDSSKPGRPKQLDCWVLHGSPEWSQVHLEDSPESILVSLQTAFQDALGMPIPNPVYQSAHRWRYAQAESPRGDGYLLHRSQRLGVAGDWLQGNRIEGAWRSGHGLSSAIDVCSGD